MCIKIMRGSRGGGGWGTGAQTPPPPLKSHKNIGFPRNTVPDRLKITKLPSQNSMLGHHWHASKTPFKWHFTGVLMMAQHWMLIFQGIWIRIAKKPYIFVIFQGGSGSAHCFLMSSAASIKEWSGFPMKMLDLFSCLLFLESSYTQGYFVRQTISLHNQFYHVLISSWILNLQRIFNCGGAYFQFSKHRKSNKTTVKLV